MAQSIAVGPSADARPAKIATILADDVYSPEAARSNRDDMDAKKSLAGHTFHQATPVNQISSLKVPLFRLAHQAYAVRKGSTKTTHVTSQAVTRPAGPPSASLVKAAVGSLFKKAGLNEASEAITDVSEKGT